MPRPRQKGEQGKEGQAPIPTREQILRFVKQCEWYAHTHRNRGIILTFFCLGLRPKECASLKLSDVYDIERDQLHDELLLRSDYTKRAKVRAIPIDNALLEEHLLSYIRHERKDKGLRFRPNEPLFMSQRGAHFTANSIGNLMNKLLEKRFGFHRGSAYSGRRYFATSLHENGTGIKTIQELMGHSNVQTTMRYVESSIKQKRKAVSGVL